MRGRFTQGICLLTEGQTTIEDLKAALKEHGFEIVRERPAEGDWQYSGAGVTVAFRPDVNGYVAVDVVNQPWPDGMGDKRVDSRTFAAWSTGFFGPFTFPGGLKRARQHNWSWKPASTIAMGHRGFIRIRMSYVFGATDKDAPLWPQDCDPVAEMMFITRMALALLQAPGVICYFNPNGEVLRDRTSFIELWDRFSKLNESATGKDKTPPLPLWMNIRFGKLGEDLLFMDTVGNQQLQINDLETIFRTGDYRPADVDFHLRNITDYLRRGAELKSGESIDGPGDQDLSWTLETHGEGLLPPPRPVVRLSPKAYCAQIRQVLADEG